MGKGCFIDPTSDLRPPTSDIGHLYFPPLRLGALAREIKSASICACPMKPSLLLSHRGNLRIFFTFQLHLSADRPPHNLFHPFHHIVHILY